MPSSVEPATEQTDGTLHGFNKLHSHLNDIEKATGISRDEFMQIYFSLEPQLKKQYGDLALEQQLIVEIMDRDVAPQPLVDLLAGKTEETKATCINCRGQSEVEN